MMSHSLSFPVFCGPIYMVCVDFISLRTKHEPKTIMFRKCRIESVIAGMASDRNMISSFTVL